MAGDLTTLANVKAWLNLSTPDVDDLLSSMISACSAGVEAWLGREIVSATRTQVLNGMGGTSLVLPQWPVTAVTAVSVDGVDIPAAATVTAQGFLFDEYAIYLRGFVFTPGIRNVSVTYSAGYASPPADIARAVTELVAFRFRERERIGHASKSLAGETVSFTITDLPQAVKTALAPYRKVALA